tara:strand:- start:1157 stop:1630 length:474 start_codon:yes stop_codon:yes gene_type:complete
MSKTPYEIAHNIFTQDPQEINSKIIELDDKNQDVSYLFEIFLNILLEGIDILSNGLDKAQLNNFDETFILNLNPWLKSLGICVNVDLIDSIPDNYYCKIIIKNNSWKPFFNLKNITNNYHFLLSSKYKNLNFNFIHSYKALFINNNQNYLIYFSILN